jgi:arylsulfatase A-like enzyme
VNILFITLDQFRADCLSVAGHPLLRTPHLDRLAREGVRFARHYSQSAPCSPGRACLYTGTYQFNNRVVANGTPLDARFDNVAHAARRAGYVPTLFGYTDQSIDPREADGPNDPRLSNYEGILPGFDTELDLIATRQTPWVEWLRERGYALNDDAEEALKGETDRPADVSASAFLTDRLIDWIAKQRGPWFAHASYLRPHPPYTAAGKFARMYDPASVPAHIEQAEQRHKLHDAFLGNRRIAAPRDPAKLAELKAQYFGMISEVDAQLGRLFAVLESAGLWDDTFIIVTSDHGEHLGDHGLIQKGGFFETSYHVLSIIRDPRRRSAYGTVVDRFTENVDIFPTLCDAMNVAVPPQCDGFPLTPFLEGNTPERWRDAAHWEYDWRFAFIGDGQHDWPWDRRLHRQHLSVLRGERAAYVQFGDGSWLCFDLARDPTWRTETRDPAVVLPLAQAMLAWRSHHTERTLTDMLVEKGGVGRWPPMPTLR